MKIEIIYIGKRYIQGDLCDVFRNVKTKEEYSWTGIKSVSIGDIYICEEKRKGKEKAHRIKMRPEYVRSAGLDEEELEEYQTKTWAALQEKARDRAASKLQKSYDFENLITLFSKVTAKLNYKETRFFAEKLAEEKIDRENAKINADINAKMKRLFAKTKVEKK